ncbi:16S rRNA (cytosine(1402)-N(4))-methyltransferase RsmH [Patescibacteria group bacterium]|nr:16S rRNA (cytosine(1402)-N(4))-methyltransferase RsmH [Patescibacteria group bacterium]MBU1663207.1 16S rRNA (cytosine(1402)-N(4))-methyltransferase RsmH [Patescibacteria group bacterium]MBU2233764.1 16S rRNA (cytosine(1402)-N(4))-methyltransferase RsmH [Patescibacteria group bacterium]MBU2264231.1 16S rRNA (cytosine(1402)-N(4))-methyltransferase RsmH [Patescibacteria group bacterium]
MKYNHIPVMLNQVIAILNPQFGQKFIDCTLGGGGYSKAILERIGQDGQVLAIDIDGLAITNAKLNFKTEIKNKKLILAHENFKNLRIIAEKYFEEDIKFNGIVLDLGLSSAQLEDKHRGFSFNIPVAPLGMNFGEQIGETAENIINSRNAEDLAKIFKDYGEEKFAYKIALAIVNERQLNRIVTAGKLVEIIMNVAPKRFQSKIHPATKIFQALRIAVNQELENLQAVLPQAISLLKIGGKLIIISYHSLEDRIVKQYFKQESKDCLCPPIMPICRCGHKANLKILTHKILRPVEQEILKNPRSRSARLRAVYKII